MRKLQLQNQPLLSTQLWIEPDRTELSHGSLQSIIVPAESLIIS